MKENLDAYLPNHVAHSSPEQPPKKPSSEEEIVTHHYRHPNNRSLRSFSPDSNNILDEEFFNWEPSILGVYTGQNNVSSTTEGEGNIFNVTSKDLFNNPEELKHFLEDQFDNPEVLKSLIEHYKLELQQYGDQLSSEEQRHLLNVFNEIHQLREECNEVFLDKSLLVKEYLKPVVENLEIHSEKIKSFSPSLFKAFNFLKDIEGLPVKVDDMDSRGLMGWFVQDKREGIVPYLLLIIGQLENLKKQGIDITNIKISIDNCINLINQIDSFMREVISPIDELWIKLADRLGIEYST